MVAVVSLAAVDINNRWHGYARAEFALLVDVALFFSMCGCYGVTMCGCQVNPLLLRRLETPQNEPGAHSWLTFEQVLQDISS